MSETPTHHGIDLVGQKFGRLTVKKLAPRKPCYKASLIWECECDCGEIRHIPGGALRSGHRISCGCLPRTPKYKRWTGFGDISGASWWHIVNRAKKGNIPLEITIQDAWAQFLKQDGKCALTGLSLSFETNHKNSAKQTASLDRKDSNKGYTRENIQWVYKTVNFMKAWYDEKYFIQMCELVVNHNQKKKICTASESPSPPSAPAT